MSKIWESDVSVLRSENQIGVIRETYFASKNIQIFEYLCG